MTRARSRRTARRKIKRQIRKTLNIICAVWDFIARHPAMLAMPLIIFLLVLTIQMHEFEKQVQAWDQEIRQQQEQIEELYDRQDPVEQTDMTDVYGCKSLYGTYDFPWNTMSQDWGSDQVTGFYYHEISEECKAAGGELPTIIQVYTYIVCEQNGVDYEMVFALIEQESRCRWDAEGDNGTSIGLMQVSEKWHMQRMEELGAYDLTNPYQNVLVGVNYLSEIQNDLRGTVSDEDLPYYTLAVYNYGKQGAKANLWDQGVVKYTYNTKIMDRAQQLKEEKKKAEEGRKKKRGYRANERRGLGAMEPERTSGTGTAASLPEWGEPQQSRSGETETDGCESWDSGSVSSGSDGNVQRFVH